MDEFFEEHYHYYDPVFHQEIDTFDNQKSHDVKGSRKLYEIIEFVRYNLDPHIALNPKFIDGVPNPEYDKLKTKKPVVCFNATFNGYCDLLNLKSPTNLMFLEIDGFTSKQQAQEYKERIIFHHSWIIACYLSASRLGLHIVIKTDKIWDNEDFKKKYEYISKTYFGNRLDLSANKITQFSIVPFDFDIYLNKVPTVLPVDQIINNGLPPSHYQENPMFPLGGKPYKFEEDQAAASGEESIRYNNFEDLDGYDNEGVLYSDTKDIQVVMAFIRHKKINIGFRQAIISCFAHNLLWLNPWLSEPRFRSYLYKINKELCAPPLPDKEIEKIIRNKQDLLARDRLQPITQERMVVFHPTLCKYSKEAKQQTSLAILANSRKVESRRKIRYILDNWDIEKLGKVSIRKIAGHHPISKKTVEKYYPEFRELINEINQEVSIYKNTGV